MISMKRSERVTISVIETQESPVTWEAFPHSLVKLTPSTDLRSCLVEVPSDVPLGMGRAIVKARNAQGNGILYISIAIAEDQPLAIAAQGSPSAAAPPDASIKSMDTVVL